MGCANIRKLLHPSKLKKVMKKNTEFYEAVLKEFERKFDSKLPNESYAFNFRNPTPETNDPSSSFSKKYFSEKKIQDLIPLWSNNQMKNGDKLEHVFQYIRISFLAICCLEVGEDGGLFVDRLQEIFEIKEYEHLFHPFIPKMERLVGRMGNNSFGICTEARHGIENLKEKVILSKHNSDRTSASYKVTEEDKLIKSLSFDVVFKEMFLFLDVFELVELSLISKSFCENIWNYSLGNRNLKSKEIFYFLFCNGREVSDSLLLKFLKYRVIDTKVFIDEYLYPHCFRRGYLNSLSHILSSNTEYDFLFKAYYTDPDEFEKRFCGTRPEHEYYKHTDYRHKNLCSILTCIQCSNNDPDFRLSGGKNYFERLLKTLLCFRFDTILSKGIPPSVYVEFVFTLIRIFGLDERSTMLILSKTKFMKNEKSILVLEPVFRRFLVEKRNDLLEKKFLKDICKNIAELYSTVDFGCDFPTTSPAVICETIFEVCGIDPSFDDHALLLNACEKLDWNMVKILLKFDSINPSYNNNQPFFLAMNAEAESQWISNNLLVEMLAERIKINSSDEKLRCQKLFEKCYEKKKYKLVDLLLQRIDCLLLQVSEKMILDAFNRIRESDYFYEKDQSGNLPIGMLLSLLNARKIVPETFDRNSILDLACEKGLNKVVRVLIQRGGLDPTNRGTNSPIKKIIQNDYRQGTSPWGDEEEEEEGEYNAPMNILMLRGGGSHKYDPTSHYWKCLKILLETGKVDPSIEDNYCIRHSQNISVIRVLAKDPRTDLSAGNYDVVMNSISAEKSSFRLFKFLLEHEEISPLVNDSEEFRERIFKKLLEVCKNLDTSSSSSDIGKHFEYVINERKFEVTDEDIKIDIISGLARCRSNFLFSFVQDHDELLFHAFSGCYDAEWKEGIWEMLRKWKKRLIVPEGIEMIRKLFSVPLKEISPKDRIKMLNFYGKICTSVVSSKEEEKILQSVNQCLSCSCEDGEVIICEVCRRTCHRGHKTKHLGYRVTFCGCSKTNKYERGFECC